jgi:FAD binding domain in molybdopterin dehydrogenase/Molybdopterin-binding domain of aldehyde dehydrogenase
MLGCGLVAPTQRALAPFVLCRPRSSGELRTALAEHPDATLAAGTTDLFARIREGLAPRVVVSIRGVPELAWFRRPTACFAWARDWVGVAPIDTDHSPFDQGTKASSGVAVMGQAVTQAALRARDAVLAFAAEQRADAVGAQLTELPMTPARVFAGIRHC